MAKHEVHFDEGAHIYTVEGVPRPNVTGILDQANLVDSDWFTEESRIRGSAVHAATHYYDEDDLPEEWMATSKYAGYVRGWIKFREEFGFVPQIIERPMFHPVLGYCGKPDRVGCFKRGSVVEQDILIDIKTGAEYDWHFVQTAAYAAFFEKPTRFRRLCVYLSNEGTFRVKEAPAGSYPVHFNIFQACLIVKQFREGGFIGYSNRRAAA